MKPTNKLRWVIRKSWQRLIGPSDGNGNVLILQQWWAVEFEGQETPKGEWRDVRIESEI